jgi:hypothetical protein
MNSHEDRPSSDAIEDMLADSEFGAADEAALRSALADIGSLATESPAPSAWVTQMIQGDLIHGGMADAPTDGTTRHIARRRLAIAATASALVLGGASAAAATNSLPESIQEAFANATNGLPVNVPHPGDHPKPVKPTSAPTDAPGQLKDKSETDATDEAQHDNSDAPGQIQKATKPDPSDPGPARPADPGSHGRARAAEVQATHDKGDNKKVGKRGDWNPAAGWGNSATDHFKKHSKSDQDNDDSGDNDGGGHGGGHGGNKH